MYQYSVIPFLAYWLACGFCSIVKRNTRKNITETSVTNAVSDKKVFYSVLALTASTILGNYLLLFLNIIHKEDFRFWFVLIGIWWVDTIEYFTHLIMHRVPFLYKNFHKEHHKVIIPYSYGALYNSDFEAIVTSSMMMYGFYLMKISFPEFIVVTTLANIATVLDHSEEFAKLGFKNNFHKLHHSKYQNHNFQQPFFTYYDRLFGTYKTD